MKYKIKRCAPEIGWAVIYWPKGAECGHVEFFSSRIIAQLFAWVKALQ